MKTLLIFIFLVSSLTMGCYGQSSSNRKLVHSFIQAYNEKDSLKAMELLHPDFVELFQNDTTIFSKESYADNYAWGKQMDDRIEFEILESDAKTVKINSTYHCLRDKILDLGPYISQRSYMIKDDKIFKIIETYKEQDYVDRRTVYEDFFKWLERNKNLFPADFPFNSEGAKALITVLNEYASKHN